MMRANLKTTLIDRYIVTNPMRFRGFGRITWDDCHLRCPCEVDDDRTTSEQTLCSAQPF